MKGQGFVKLGQTIRKELFNDLSDPLMDFLAFSLENTVVNNILGQGMFKNVLQIRLKRPCADQVQALQTAETFVNIVFELCDPLEDLIEKGPPDHRSFLKHPF
jgi:hypothetical protein